MSGSPFIFTTRQPFCNRSCRLKFCLTLFFFFYLSLTACAFYFTTLYIPSYQYYILIALLIPFNLAVILTLGNTFTHSILFPYSNSCFSLKQKKDTSASFGDDFVKIYRHIAKSVKLMLDKHHDEFEDMTDVNTELF